MRSSLPQSTKTSHLHLRPSMHLTGAKPTLLSTSSCQLHSKPSMGYPHTRGVTCATMITFAKSRETEAQSQFTCSLVPSFVF